MCNLGRGSLGQRLRELTSVTFFDLAKKGANRGFIAHGGEIKGPSAEEASKKAAKMEGKTVKTQAWKSNNIFINFGFILGAIFDQKHDFDWKKGSKNPFKKGYPPRRKLHPKRSYEQVRRLPDSPPYVSDCSNKKQHFEQEPAIVAHFGNHF